jgi:MSHA pilin protein MshA
MKRLQKGFTLIELVVVIIILGILAAVALPKFIDLTGDALQAAVQGVAGGVTSGAAINYGARVANNTNPNTTAVATATCTTAVLGAFLTGGWPTAANGVTYTPVAAPIATNGACTTSGSTFTCQIDATKGSTTKSATATIICTG